VQTPRVSHSRGRDTGPSSDTTSTASPGSVVVAAGAAVAGALEASKDVTTEPSEWPVASTAVPKLKLAAGQQYVIIHIHQIYPLSIGYGQVMYVWVTEPYMYGSMRMGMPYGGYPTHPYGVNSFNNLALQALAMQGYPASYQRPETEKPTHHWHSEAVAVRRPKLPERPKDTCVQPQSSEHNQQMGSESRNRTKVKLQEKRRWTF